MHVTLWRDEAVLRTAISAAGERHEVRSRLFVRVEHAGVEGFGEVAPQPTSLNGDASVDEVIVELLEVVVPVLAGISERDGSPPSWRRVAGLVSPRPASRPALALVEMALLDRQLRASASTLHELWPSRFATPSQCTVSLIDDDEWSIPSDVARVRVKTSPGALDAAARANLGALAVPVLLDFNCSASDDDEVLEQVAAVSRCCQLDGVEQPYGVSNLVDTARLRTRLGVEVSLDETIRSSRDVTNVVRYEAADMICVKPARVGGVSNARAIVLRAREAGLRAYVGGFFESAFARSVHHRLATSCTPEPSDTRPVVLTSHGPREVESTPYGLGVRPSDAMLANARILASGDAERI